MSYDSPTTAFSQSRGAYDAMQVYIETNTPKMKQDSEVKLDQLEDPKDLDEFKS